jgi:hypothetical protein
LRRTEDEALPQIRRAGSTPEPESARLMAPAGRKPALEWEWIVMHASIAVARGAGVDRMDVLERGSRDSVIERRNFFMGLWAGRLLGYEGEDLAIYAGEIMASDLLEPGPQDVIGRIVADFAAGGVPVGEAEVGLRISQTERFVRAELLSTD